VCGIAAWNTPPSIFGYDRMISDTIPQQRLKLTMLSHFNAPIQIRLDHWSIF
jgi:hypothetical protein